MSDRNLILRNFKSKNNFIQWIVFVNYLVVLNKISEMIV